MESDRGDEVGLPRALPEDGWADHYPSQHQHMNQVIQIMVPGLNCMEQGSSSDSTSMVHVSTSADMHPTDIARVTKLLQHEHPDVNNKNLDIETTLADDAHFHVPHFLDRTHPDTQFFSEIYHYLYSQTLPPEATDSHQKIIKKRSTSYSIDKEGVLVYGTKIHKKIITDPDEQRNVMTKFHIDEGTGVHIGVRKMNDLISSAFFWRSMYVDIGWTVRNCPQCTEVVPLASQNKDPVENPLELFLAEQRNRVWKKVDARIVGPLPSTSNGNQYVMRITDHYSQFIIAEATTWANLEKDFAKFIFKCFCKFGFAQCTVSGMASPEFDAVNVFYRNKVQLSKDIFDNLPTLAMTDPHQTQNEDIVENFCRNNPENWDQNLEIFVYQHCIKTQDDKTSPFVLMFGRNPTGTNGEDEKENIGLLDARTTDVPTRRRLRSSTLQCRHCCEIFTSKISFRIHQRKHTDEARRRGAMDGQTGVFIRDKKVIHKVKKRRKSFARGVDRLLSIAGSDWSGHGPPLAGGPSTQSTVEAVKTLLQATKEERNKRGKYVKYTQELRDQIAKYAMDHSTPAASMYWSDRLGSTVSESSIRNFIKAYKSFSLATKEEIGRYAFHNGLERAVIDYSHKLGFELRKGVVIKFKKLYMEKVCDTTSNSSMGDKRNRSKRAYSLQMKEEIGRYACNHGIPAAIDHFSMKLQFAVKESTVRKFKRRYQDKHMPTPDYVQQGTPLLTQQPNPSHGPMEVLHPSLSVIGAPNPSSSTVTVSSSNNFVYQHPYSINMAQPNALHSNTLIPMNSNLTFHQGGLINQSVASLSYQQSPAPQTVIMNQAFNPVGTPTFQQGYVNNFSPGTQNIQGVQAPPIAVTHTSLASSLGHTNPLQLTMGPTPLAQLNPVGIPPSHHMGGHNIQVSNTSPHQIPQQVTSVACFHQPVSSLPFDNGSQAVNNAHIINTEPLSLMKEPNQEPLEIQQSAQTTPTNTIPIIHIQPNNAVQQLTAGHHDTSTEQDIDDDSGPNDEANSLSLEPEDLSEPPTPLRRRRSKKSTYHKVSYTCGKRGNYGSYSPELRAEIGKFATDNGNLATMVHFKQKLDLNIPESTVRGLKDKYVSKRMREEKEVQSLGFGQRGRPMRLGKYDVVVQDCIRELVKQGEKVSSFLVIATAKQVLIDNEPSLLEENGGPVTLNPTWAKSFLKRIGLNQLS